MSKSVSDIIAETLVSAGAQRVYGIVGDTINHFTDAVRRSDLNWVHVRHEEVGALAAGGESYMTGELSVCAGTTGPGSLHFVNGIFESHRNGAPVVLIASNIERAEEGLGFPQEVDQKKVYEQASVFCERISHPDQTRRITAQAAQAALTKGGVAVVIVNGDMFRETTKDDLQWAVHRPQPVIRPSEAELDALAGMIAEAERITIYAGIGARGAAAQIRALSERLAAPVAHTTRAKEFIEPDMPNNVGMTGILGNRAGMEAMGDCDLLLCLGSDFAYTQFYPGKAKIVQLDIDPTRLGRRAPIHLGLAGDVGDTIDALLPRLAPREPGKHLDRALKAYAEDLKGYLDSAEEPDPSLIHPQHLTELLDRFAAKDAIFTADGGSPMVWLLRHLSANGERRFLTSLLHGTMANAYPQALGIQEAYPERQVIAMCGDGGMTMLMGDLLTLVQEKLPVKLLVYNNASLGFVEMEQRVEGMLDAFTGLHNPDFGAMARAIGMEGMRVESASDLDGAVRDWLAAPGPALLDVKVNRMELVMPPKIEPAQVGSTALFGVKAVLNGRADEVVSLMRDNFLR
ncbi:thiamine pyrophosphate-dependent enzyme [Thioclava electrotropha]|uniref:Ubiquinone-dependent pyruvate dehydrogenase n=1 Tax=Thioclava electrotropha TaxID=1549850 RepID=A0ABX6YRA4_9RHOB|nr:thiamine pyrophosphate-dependent enzyme [Thioclava electrotropha]QPZ90320.1 ubiquinone-dependent pyruvate dehydrogenase [Thioclava electrotropha]